MEQIEKLAGVLYETYCTAVGGKAFNGDPLPDWATFRADPAKQKQSDAWWETAQKCFSEENPVFGALQKANELLRSAHSIAERSGTETNWPAFLGQVTAGLLQHHYIIHCGDCYTNDTGEPSISNADQSLACAVKDDLLTISIGIKTLAFAAEHQDGNPKIKIVSLKDLGADVVSELMHEDEIGATMITDLLDEAVTKACENGSVAFDEDQPIPER